MVRLVLFDIDGTLIRTGGAGVKAFGRAFATEFAVPRGTERLKFAGRTDSGLVQEFFRRNQIEPTPHNFQRFFDCYVFWLDHLLGQLNGGLCPQVREFLGGLQALPEPPLLGLLTGNIRLGAEIKLRHFQLWDEFHTGGFGDDHVERNQIAAIARDRACRLLNRKLRGEQILVIGDTPLDIACARAIEARVLAVATGGSTWEQLQMHGPDWAVTDLGQVTPADVCRQSG